MKSFLNIMLLGPPLEFSRHEKSPRFATRIDIFLAFGETILIICGAAVFPQNNIEEKNTTKDLTAHHGYGIQKLFTKLFTKIELLKDTESGIQIFFTDTKYKTQEN